MADNISVFDCDGHIIESIPENGSVPRSARSRHRLELAAKQMIHETVERTDLTHAEKAGVLGENAKRFFRL